MRVKWCAGSALCVLALVPASWAVAQSRPQPAAAPPPAPAPAGADAPRSVEGVVVTAVRPKEQILLDRRV
ncbi:MAG: hypothetical protein JWO83_4993, partial [Caulobacteraceae bacterium]|nr:hypothetical protein [Caulobacteraceae bacterium]